VAIRAFPDSGLSSSRLEAVINAGFCGALISRLRESDIVVGTSVLDKEKGESFDCDLLDCKNSGASSGTIVTQNRIANDSEEKAHLSGLGALAVDMEAAGVAARSKRAGLPFYCIKVVSDRLDESFDVDLNAMRTAEGRIARGKIIMHALTHPRVMPGLFRLKRRSESAAEALGEFLVSCRIRPESSNSAAN
jgi:adenosylhomocysteine nucleosidase